MKTVEETDLVPHRGRLFKAFLPLTRYFFTNLTALLSWPFFRLLNRTVMFGTENVGEAAGTLLLANHQSLIDGFVIGLVWYPKTWLKPRLLPWNPAAAENFYRNPLIAWCSDNWKCLPVQPGRKDFGAMIRMRVALQTGTMTIFPEGTRTRDGRLLPPRSGIAFVMHQAHPIAIPVAIDGLDRVLPVGSRVPRVFQTMYIYYGRPVVLDDLYTLPATRETAELIIARVFSHVRRQKTALERLRRRARRGGLYAP